MTLEDSRHQRLWWKHNVCNLQLVDAQQWYLLALDGRPLDEVVLDDDDDVVSQKHHTLHLVVPMINSIQHHQHHHHHYQGCGVLGFLWDSASDSRVRKFRTPDSLLAVVCTSGPSVSHDQSKNLYTAYYLIPAVVSFNCYLSITSSLPSIAFLQKWTAALPSMDYSGYHNVTEAGPCLTCPKNSTTPVFQLTLLANISTRYCSLLCKAATHLLQFDFLCNIYKCSYLLRGRWWPRKYTEMRSRVKNVDGRLQVQQLFYIQATWAKTQPLSSRLIWKDRPPAIFWLKRCYAFRQSWRNMEVEAGWRGGLCSTIHWESESGKVATTLVKWPFYNDMPWRNYSLTHYHV